MVYIILSHLVESGLISLPSEIDARLQQERLDQLMKELLQDANGLNQTTENDIASNVDNNSIPSEPPHKKKKRVHFNLTTSTAPSKQLSEHVYPSGGLLNRGKSNMCFANSLLQCLRVTDVHRILQNHKCQEACVTCTFKDFIEEGPVTAEPLLRQLNGIWPEYRYGVQQDVHEFYNKLMQEIHNKCLRATDMNTADSIFHGVQTSTVTCANCGFKSTRQEIYSDISVAIDGVQSTSEAVNRFFTPVEIEYECQLCKDKNKQATLATTLDSIPKNIVIHLKRFDGGFRKNRKKVDLDHKLNLRRFVSEGKVLEDKAELFAVIFHYGKSCKSGHYYCFIKFGQHWFQIDDMKVKSVTELALKNSVDQEYLLFFKTLPRPYIT